MFENAFGAKDMMEDLIAAEVSRLVVESDVAVFVLYRDATLHEGPCDFIFAERGEDGSAPKIEVGFDFEGLGIWYLCRRKGETFHMRHIVVEIDSTGRFVRGQVGEQEGYWEDFPTYVTDERFVSTVVEAKAA